MSFFSSISKSGRQALFAFLILFGWVVFLYCDTATAIVLIWSRSETFTHGFLVPPIVLWLVWRKRAEIALVKPQSSLLFLWLAALLSFAWLLGELASVNAVTQLAFVALLAVLVPTVVGWPLARLIIFPLGFLFFAVPIGEFAMPQLMVWTADVTIHALRLSGIPVYREGLQFVIPSGNWSVVEACSGVRYLIASVTVGTLFAYLNYQSTSRRVLFIITSFLVPVVANWIRAYLIVMLGHFSGNRLATGVDHLVYGWVFFGIVIMLMFWIGARWAEPDVPTPSAQSPSQLSEFGNGFALTPKFWATALGFAIVVALPHAALKSIEQATDNFVSDLRSPAVVAGPWVAVVPAEVSFKPAFQNPAAEQTSTFANQGRQVGLYLGYYLNQNYASKLVSSSNVVIASKDAHWALVNEEPVTVDIKGQQVKVRSSELRDVASSGQTADGRLLVWQIYWINGTLTSNDYVAKVYSAFYRLLGRGDASAVIVVYTAHDALGADKGALQAFLSTNYASVDELLTKARRPK